MDHTIVLVYCLCDDLLKALGHKEDPQCRMSDAEVMTAGRAHAWFTTALAAHCLSPLSWASRTEDTDAHCC